MDWDELASIVILLLATYVLPRRPDTVIISNVDHGRDADSCYCLGDQSIIVARLQAAPALPHHGSYSVMYNLYLYPVVMIVRQKINKVAWSIASCCRSHHQKEE